MKFKSNSINLINIKIGWLDILIFNISFVPVTENYYKYTFL